MNVVRGGDTPAVIEKTYLPNEWGCPRVMKEIVCEDIDLSKFSFLSKKVSDAQD
jgi:hypothetical protein